MAASPAFVAAPNNGVGTLDTANTNRDGTGTIVTVWTPGASGGRIEEIVVKATGDPADCTVVFYLHDGTTAHVFDEWDIGNPAAGSAIVASYREARTFANLVLEAGWSLRASITAALTAGTVKVHALGGDF